MRRRLWMALALCLALVVVNGRAADAAMNATDFFRLCAWGTPQAVQAALAGGADANARAQTSLTALMLAAGKNGNPEVVRVLVQAGAEVNARDKNGWTALMLAAGMNKNPEVIRALVQAGADVNARDKNGNTALIAATEAKNAGAKEALLKAGAKDSQNQNGPAMAAKDAPRHAGAKDGRAADAAKTEDSTKLYGKETPQASPVAVTQPAGSTTVQESVVNFPEIGPVTIKKLQEENGSSVITFTDASGRLLYEDGYTEGPSEDNPMREGSGFLVVDGPAAGSKVVFVASLSTSGASDCSFGGAVIDVHKGAFRKLLEEYTRSASGGMYVGDLGKKRGYGFAVWDPEHRPYPDPSRYIVRLYRLDREKGMMVKFADLKTKRKYSDPEAALKELGLNFPNLWQSIPDFGC